MKLHSCAPWRCAPAIIGAAGFHEAVYNPAVAAVSKLPPGPRHRVPGAIFRELRRDPLDFFTQLARKHGDIVSFRNLGIQYIIINSPDLAREILMGPPEVYWKGPALQNSKGILGEGLLTAEEGNHRGQRRLMQPSFHAKHVENYASAIVESTAELIAQWRRELKSREELDVRKEMMGLTLIIAGRALFGAMLSDDIHTVHRCMDDLMNNYVRAVVPWGKLLNLLPLPSTRKLKRAQRDLFGLVTRLVAEKRSKPRSEGRPDLLSMMIAATDDSPDTADGKVRTRLTDTQLRDQCVTILTAGHETTANAMTFTLYLLAKYPEEQRRLREGARVLEGRPLDAGVLDLLPRTRWVLSESMRLYPPAWTMGRQNRVPVELGGYHLPSRCTILIPQWTLHRNEKYWDRPLEFLPDRWREPRHPRFAYLPFSTGHRNCIGESFAWLEMMLALPMLLRAFEFSLTETRDLPLTPAITLRPKGPVRLKVSALQ